MRVIYAQEPLVNMKGMIIFLAGPTPRDAGVESWRPSSALSILKDIEFDGTVLLPEMRGVFTDDFEYSDQIDWEQEGFEIADKIIFWVPRDLKTMPAFTTNIEFGYWLAKNPSKIIMGYPKGTVKMDYIEYMCSKHRISPINSLGDTINYAIDKHYRV